MRLGRLVEPQQGVAEGRGGVVQVVGREDDGHALRPDAAEEVLEARAARAAGARAGSKPSLPARKAKRAGKRHCASSSSSAAATGVEEAGQRGLELGGRVGLAARREEEVGAVGLALPAAERPRAGSGRAGASPDPRPSRSARARASSSGEVGSRSAGPGRRRGRSAAPGAGAARGRGRGGSPAGRERGGEEREREERAEHLRRRVDEGEPRVQGSPARHLGRMRGGRVALAAAAAEALVAVQRLEDGAWSRRRSRRSRSGRSP